MQVLAQAPGFEFPPVNELFDFRPLTSFSALGVTFHITFVTVLLFVVPFMLLALGVVALRRPKVVPTGLQNFVEMQISYVRESILLPVLGPDGERFLPLLVTFFFFVFGLNIMGITPLVSFPVTSRMALPAMLAGISYVVFNVLGIKEHGLLRYLKINLFPPGVPKPIYIILTPIELFSTFIVRPVTLAVRLFANMMAGHVMLTIFYLGSWYFLFVGGQDSILLRVFSPFPILGAVAITALEAFVSYIQAFIITILTAVYISGAVAHEH